MSCATLNMDPGVQTFQNTTTTNQTTLLEKEHNHPNNYKKKTIRLSSNNCTCGDCDQA